MKILRDAEGQNSTQIFTGSEIGDANPIRIRDRGEERRPLT
jgi:hypothetical protein